jgi:hypothetical protein
MRRVGAGSVAAVAFAALAFAVLVGAGATASADTTPSFQGPNQSAIDQCIGTDPVVGMPPSCVYDANGNLIGRTSPSGLDGGSSGPNLVPFVFLALLWSAVPFAIAVGLARSRGEPVGTAVLLILVLGWIGLLIVVYGQRRAAGDVGRLLNPVETTARSAPPPESPEARLRKIEDLHALGLISDEERTTRRAAILDRL